MPEEAEIIQIESEIAKVFCINTGFFTNPHPLRIKTLFSRDWMRRLTPSKQAIRDLHSLQI